MVEISLAFGYAQISGVWSARFHAVCEFLLGFWRLWNLAHGMALMTSAVIVSRDSWFPVRS